MKRIKEGQEQIDRLNVFKQFEQPLTMRLMQKNQHIFGKFRKDPKTYKQQYG